LRDSIRKVRRPDERPNSTRKHKKRSKSKLKKSKSDMKRNQISEPSDQYIEEKKPPVGTLPDHN
jgi:hypothetical protein